AFDYFSILRASGEGSTIENKGSVTLYGSTSAFLAEKGAHIINSGGITSVQTREDSDRPSAVLESSHSGSLVENSTGGNITLTSTMTPYYERGISAFPLKWYNSAYYAMLAHDGATAINDEGATI